MRTPKMRTPAGKALLLVLALVPTTVAAGQPLEPKATPPQPSFNRLATFEEVTARLAAYAKAYPDWVSLQSIGKSSEGRDMWQLTLNNPATGEPLRTPLKRSSRPTRTSRGRS